MQQDNEPDLAGQLISMFLSVIFIVMVFIIIGITIVRTDNYIPTIQEDKTEEIEDVDSERLPIEA